ncbi:hypothetical protein NPIL_580221 [Nephila pilipes]|uniref:Uncharacterized protein n=1 Tax=Nephila pilipes TaxID=299642 RepID=A0A8X6N2H9_NEPPI|nr:hypothetical protein NPIL_580221 [Nephila pilipes]
MDTANNTEVCELTVIDLCDLNLEESFNRVGFLTDSKSCETYCDYLEQVIYNYSRKNSGAPDIKLISDTQHIIIRCARKSSRLLNDELKYYLQQILENVKQKLTSTLPSPRNK